MAFERADMAEDGTWMQQHYAEEGKFMNIHALESFGVFSWTFYLGWLEKNRNLEGAQEALDNFRRHPAYEQVMMGGLEH